MVPLQLSHWPVESFLFYCILHTLPITKSSAYSFDRKLLTFISSYLHNKKQKIKLGSEVSDLLIILFGVPQGSILGAILLIIFILDLFFINNNIDFASCADDTTPYVCGQNFNEVINFLENNINNIFWWFQ